MIHISQKKKKCFSRDSLKTVNNLGASWYFSRSLRIIKGNALFFQAPASRAPLLSRARQVRSLVFRARRARFILPGARLRARSFSPRPKVTGYRDVQPPSICGILRDNGAFRVRYLSGFAAIRHRCSLIHIWVFKKTKLRMSMKLSLKPKDRL